MKAKKLLIDLLDLDADTQSRIEINDDNIAQMVESLDAGETLPPIDVYFDGANYFIVNGWHRAHACLKAGLSMIEAYVHDGDLDDAMFAAGAANKDQDKVGLKRTNADKRLAVRMTLRSRKGQGLTNGAIADHCGVTDKTVAAVRKAMESEEEKAEQTADKTAGPEFPDLPSTAVKKPATRVGKDGKNYPVKEKPAPPKGPSIPTLSLPYQRATNDLLRISRDMKEIAETPAGAHLASKITRIVKSLEEAKQAIRQAEPMAVCGKCNGDGCQHCARTGFWTRMAVESKSK